MMINSAGLNGGEKLSARPLRTQSSPDRPSASPPHTDLDRRVDRAAIEPNRRLPDRLDVLGVAPRVRGIGLVADRGDAVEVGGHANQPQRVADERQTGN